MELKFEAKVVLTVEQTKERTKHVATQFNIDVNEALDKKQYLDNEDLPTKDGSIVLTTVLIQGLLGNIHMAHEKGFRDSAEHLRHIIAELERGFVAVASTGKSTF